MKRSSVFLFVLLILGMVAGAGGYWLYKMVYGPAVEVTGSQQYLYIPSNADFQVVKRELHKQGFIKDTAAFNRIARWMNYPAHIYPGKYELKQGMSNRALVRKLRSGDKAFVNLTISTFSDLPRLAGYVSKRLEADSANIMRNLNDDKLLDSLGFNKHTRLCLFIPDTYEFPWNTRARAFLKGMYRHYQNFWTMQRKAQANERELNPQEVMTLASIVQRESNRIAEWDTIAGVYLNRLNRAGMPLQADPTIQYILRQRGKQVNRIYKKHLKIASPYNTYQNRGLPPGPLQIPHKKAIKAVLNRAEHDYLYFVAKPGNKGGHRFSRTLRQHNRYARDYQRYLNQESIY